MEALLVHNMAPIMFGALVVFLLLGYPVAFALAANGLVFAVIGIELGLFPPNFLQALPERVYGIMTNDTLLAIPFFTFMGLILERSGMAEDLLDTVGQLFGPVRGGLAYAVVFVGALLAATTGVVAASVISMGLISLPIMLRYGYDRSIACGVIAASGTLAQIIPPSLVLIVMADQLGRSVGDMYEGAFVPGLVLAGLYASWILLVTLVRPGAAPALPKEAIRFREEDVRDMGRTARGVKGITLDEGDAVVAMDIITPGVEGASILSVTENGYGKRTLVEEYPLQSRGGKGVITIKTTERNGKLVGVQQITDEDDLMLITDKGKIIRLRGKEISVIGRNTQGVRLIELETGERVMALARLAEKEEESGGDEGEAIEEEDGEAMKE